MVGGGSLPGSHSYSSSALCSNRRWDGMSGWALWVGWWLAGGWFVTKVENPPGAEITVILFVAPGRITNMLSLEMLRDRRKLLENFTITTNRRESNRM